MGLRDRIVPERHQRRPGQRLLRPVRRFLQEETAGAAVLLAAAVAALVWRNAAPDAYEAVWSTHAAVALGGLELEMELKEVVNELLMVVFFYVVALEIKREALHGDLRDRRRAVLPVVAAGGAMTGAALVYVVLNLGDGGALRGWAIPVATDIAFAVAILALLGDRAPRQLRTFLLTLAIVDDVATIVIIAVFYAEAVSLGWLGVAVATALAIWLLLVAGFRWGPVFAVLAAVLWLATFESGVHATIAGVVLGLLTPARPAYPKQAAGEAISEDLGEIARAPDREVTDELMRDAEEVSRGAVSPLARLEEALHPWSAFAVLPIFGLANAGIPVSIEQLGDVFASSVGLGIVLGLVVGAPVGGVVAALVLARTTRARLPADVDRVALAGVGPLKGIGFTVAIFLATLAFPEGERLQVAKLAVLLGSALSATIGFLVLYARHRRVSR